MTRPSADEVRSRAVDAAAACFRELGVAGTSVDDLVRTSGIARSTLYRHVGDRNDLLLAVVLREIDELRAALVERLDGTMSVIDLLVDGVVHAVDLVQASAVLHELLANPSLLADEVSMQALDALVTRLQEFVSPLFVDHREVIRPDLDPTVAVEHLVRTIRSLTAFGVGGAPSRTDRRRYLRQTLVPVFVADDVARSLDLVPVVSRD